MLSGFMLPALHPLELNLAAAEHAISAGFDSLWVPDHLLGVYPPKLWNELSLSSLIPDPDGWLDPFCLAAILSQKFAAPIGTGVTDSIRRRPADIARAILTLQHANTRGFILGIGAGERESTVPFGYDFDKPVAKLESFLAELRCLLSTGTMPQGLGRIGLPLRSEAGTPQIWLAAHGPRMQRLAGTYADGWLPLGLSPEDYGAALESVNESARSAGRASPVASMVAIVILSKSRKELARVIDRSPLSKMLMLFASAETWRRYGLEHPAGPSCRGFVDVIPHALDPDSIRAALNLVPVEMLEEFVLLGNADEVAQSLQRWTRNGLSHVVIANYSGVEGPAAAGFDQLSELSKLSSLISGI